jgi:hypothetical protein
MTVTTRRYVPVVPRISEFYGISIYMYWKDHGPAHVHAFYAGDEALVKISDGSFLTGSLPHTAARLVRDWVALRQAELVANWERAQVPEALLPIDGLR